MAGIQEGNKKRIGFLRPRLGKGTELHVIGQIKSQVQPKVKGGKREPSFDGNSYQLTLNRVFIQGGVKHWNYFCNQSVTHHLYKFCSPLGISK